MYLKYSQPEEDDETEETEGRYRQPAKNVYFIALE